MSQSGEAWNDVGEQFKRLGATFKRHYESHDGTQGPEVPSEDEVKDALRTLGESVKHALGAVGDTVSDPEIKEETRQTTALFFDALAVTFSELGDDISKRHETTQDPADPPEPAPSAPAEDE